MKNTKLYLLLQWSVMGYGGWENGSRRQFTSTPHLLDIYFYVDDHGNYQYSRCSPKFDARLLMIENVSEAPNLIERIIGKFH